MKKISFIVFAAAAFFGLVSCNKDARPASVESVPVRLVVGIEGSAGTRVTGIVSNDETSEAKVNSLQILVFNGDALDGYGSSTGSKTATVSCTSGSRDIYAVVNAGSLSGITSKSALLAQVSTLANEPSNFQMIGHKVETLQADGNVTIGVDRLAARVVIRGIKNAISNETLASQFRLVSVYLTNVAGDVDFGKSSSYSVSKWWNRRGYEADNNLGSFTYDAIGVSVAAGASDLTPHFFYTMPNGFPGAVGGQWSPRAARLVIRAEIAGVLYDYPILLPALESNKSYEINLVNITKNGNIDDNHHDPDDPDDIDEENPVVGFEQGFEITVNDWTVVLLGEEGEITI